MNSVSTSIHPLSTLCSPILRSLSVHPPIHPFLCPPPTPVSTHPFIHVSPSSSHPPPVPPSPVRHTSTYSSILPSILPSVLPHPFPRPPQPSMDPYILPSASPLPIRPSLHPSTRNSSGVPGHCGNQLLVQKQPVADTPGDLV